MTKRFKLNDEFYSLETTVIRYALAHQCDWNLASLYSFLAELAEDENQ
jgi:hypothetical protein